MSELSDDLKKIELSSTDQAKTERLFSLLSTQIKSKYKIKETEDLKKLVMVRIEENRGAISYSGAISHLAQEFDPVIWAKFTGYEKNNSEVLEMEKAPILNIDEINNLEVNTKVSIKGFVLSVSPPTEFTRKEQKSSVSRIKIGDEENQVDLVLWGRPTQEIDKYAANLRSGRKVLAENVSVRKNTRRTEDPTELHFIKETVVTFDIDEQDKKARKAFYVSGFAQTTLKKKDGSTVDAEGQITHIYPVNTFNRKDGSVGKVRNIQAIDKRGNSVRIALWPPAMDIVDWISIGSTVYFSNFQAKENNYNSKMEFSSQFNSYIEIISDPPTVKIEDILTGDSPFSFTVAGKVVTINAISEFSKRTGETGKVRRVRISDEGKSINLVVWDKAVDNFTFDREDEIIATSVRLNEKTTDAGIQREIHTTANTKFKKASAVSAKKEVSKEQPVIDTDSTLNILSGFLILLFSSFLTMDSIPSISETMFFLKVNEYMDEKRLAKIKVDDLKNAVEYLIKIGRIARDGDHLAPA